MATALSEIENHLSCSVCLGIPTNPYELTCRHSFCLECIQQVKRRNTIKCPECRESTHFKEIKHDFKTQRLVDTLNYTKEPHATTKQKIKCDLCKNAKFSVKYRCLECAQFMCQNCKGIHEAIVLCNHHTVKSIDQIICSLETNIAKVIKKLKDEENYICERSSRAQKIKSDIKTEKLSQFAAVDRYIDSIIEKAKKHKQKLKQQIESYHSQILETVTSHTQILNNNYEQVQRKRILVTAKSDTNDLFTLLKMNSTIEAEVRKEILSLRSSYPQINVDVKSPVKIKTKSRRWNFEDSIWIECSNTAKKAEKQKVFFTKFIEDKCAPSSELIECPLCGCMNKSKDVKCFNCASISLVSDVN